MGFLSETYRTESIKLYFNCVYIPGGTAEIWSLNDGIAELKQPFNFCGVPRQQPLTIATCISVSATARACLHE